MIEANIKDLEVNMLAVKDSGLIMLEDIETLKGSF